MDDIYHQTRRILQEVEKCFQELLMLTEAQLILEVENAIKMKIATINSNCDRLDVLLYKVPVSQRQSAKIRVDQLKYDVRHIENSMGIYIQKKQRRQVEVAEREQLLNHRFTDSDETRVEIDYALQQHTQMGNVHRGVDEMISNGGNILSSLINQREVLKRTQKRMFSIGSTLGLSNHTMRLIERRFTEDRYVMLCGMLVTLLIIGLVIYFVLL